MAGGPVTFYHPSMYCVKKDGTIIIRVTGWENECHWTGEECFSPDAPDYPFWEWLVSWRGRWTAESIISSHDLGTFRQEYDSRVADSV